MKIHALSLSTKTFLLASTLLLGCSRQSPDSDSTASKTQLIPGTRMTVADVNGLCDQLLTHPNHAEARDWVKRHPQSVFSAEDKSTVAAVAQKLYDAGASQVVIEFGKSDGSEIPLMLTVFLPTDKEARQKIFALNPELSRLRHQAEMKDYGQKCLSFRLQE